MSRSQRVVLSTLALVLASMSLMSFAQAPLRLKVGNSQQNNTSHNLSIAADDGRGQGTLSGPYAFAFSGYDSGNWLVLVGSMTADRSGNITGGEVDLNSAISGPVHDVITGGSYAISSNGLGSIDFNTTTGSVTVGVATGDLANMRVIYLNQNGSNGGWGSGEISQQNPSEFNFPALAGNFAFGGQGFDSKGNPFAFAGTSTEDSSGNNSGEEDINDFGTLNNLTLTGTATSSIDANGRYTRHLVRSDGVKFDQAVYIISASGELYSGINSGGSLYTAEHLRQSGPFDNGSLNAVSVFRGGGLTKGGRAEAIVGIVSPDGNGNVTVTVDENNGTISHQQTDSGTYSVASNGRTLISLKSSGELICYLAVANGGLCIDTSKGVGAIFFEPQSAGPFSNAYFSGVFLGGTLPVYVPGVFDQIDSNFADGIGTFSSTYTQSGENGTQQNQTLKGTYAVDSTGAITISQGGNPIYYGYVVSSNEVVLISLDDNPRTSVEIKCRRRGSWIPRCVPAPQ